MRIWNLVAVVALATSVGCAVESEPEADIEEDSLAQSIAIARSRLEANFDSLLVANSGRGCQVVSGRETCIVTSAVNPSRVLRVGDSIPSVSALRLCTGSSCAPVQPIPLAPGTFHCSGLALCAPLAAGCLKGALRCEPHKGPFGGEDLTCECTVLD